MQLVITGRTQLTRLLVRLAALVSGQDVVVGHPPSPEAEEIQDVRARASSLEREAQKSERACERATARHARMREKYEERRKTAAARWREIQRLKRENKLLARDLAAVTEGSSGPRAPLPSKTSAASQRASARKAS